MKLLKKCVNNYNKEPNNLKIKNQNLIVCKLCYKKKINKLFNINLKINNY